MSHPILADPGWTSGSHCKPQAYSVGRRGVARSGRWAPTPGYFSSDGVDTSIDPAGGALEKSVEASPFIAARVSWAEGYPYAFLHYQYHSREIVQWCVGVMRNGERLQ